MSYGEILTIDGLLSPEECKEAIVHIDNLIDGGYGIEVNDSGWRKDECIHMSVTDVNGFTTAHKLFERFQNAVLPEYLNRFPILKWKNIGLLGCKAQKTLPGGGFHDWHYEGMNGQNSDRVLVWTVYLNDDFEGGETEFIYQNMRVQPVAGRCCFFPPGFLHTHRGNPPMNGTKYILTGWGTDLDPYAHLRG